jgi:hypothetical protein
MAIKGVTDDSCKLVYQYPRFGRGSDECPNTDNINSYSIGGKNSVKFSENGCRKVDREFDCSIKLYRGDD